MFSSIFKRGKSESGNRPEKAKTVASVLENDNNKKKPTSRGGTNHYDDIQPMLLEMEENERYDSITNRWSFRFLLPTDPKRYITVAGQSDEFPNDSMLDDAWEYCGEWQVEGNHVSSPSDEWIYSSSFADIDAGRYLLSTASASVVRRRRWIRSVVPKGQSPSPPSLASHSNTFHTPPRTAVATAAPTPTSTQAGGTVSSSITPNTRSSDGSMARKPKKPEKPPSFEDIPPASIAHELDGQDPTFDGPMYLVEYEADDHQTESDHDKHSDPDPIQRKGSMFGNVFGHSSSSSSTTTTSSSSSIKVHDSALLELGRQIKALEGEFKKWEESQLKEWKTATKAHLEAQVSKLEAKLKLMQAKIDAESESGLGLNMEEEMKSLSEQLEQKKKTLFFPLSRIRLGQAGVYLGLDDLWLESASGHFVLDLIPHSETPRIHLLLSGTVFDPDAGISIRMLFQRFKFAGDKNYKSIPKISFEKLAITIGLGCDIGMYYDSSTFKWVTTPKEFQIQVRSFKGPYGINRSMVAAVMSLLTPVLRTALLNRLPQELGMLMMAMSSPFCMRGEFDIIGTEISILQTAMHSVPAYLSLCGYSEQQVELFYGLQRSLERSVMIKTVEELIFYRRNLERHPHIWSKICALWNQAAILYSDKVRQSASVMTTTPTKGGGNSKPGDNLPYLRGMDYLTLVRGCDELLRKKLSLKFKLSYVDGFVSLNDMLDFTYAFVHRICNEALSKNPNSAQASRLQSMLLRIRMTYSQFRTLMVGIMGNLDSAQMKVQARCFTGPSGEVRVTIADLIAQLPLNLRLNLSRETNMGNRPLVPYFTSIKPQKDGNMLMEISHKWQQKDDSGNLPRSSARTAQTYPTSSMEFTNSPGPLLAGMDKLFEMLFSSPCLSIVAEKLSTFKPGSEIFTMAVGHKPAPPAQNEAGMGGMRSRSYTSLEIVKSSSSSTLLFAKSDTNGHPSTTSGVVSEQRIETDRADSEGGCPIHIQTAENIKMVAQVPNSQATVHLAGVVRFVEAHFQDLRAMKTHLEKMLGGEFLDEQMEILKLIFEKSSKYMLSPDLDIAVNINGKLINVGGDSLCLRVETPDEVRVDTATDERHHDLVPPNSGSKPNLTNKDSTVEHPNRRRPSTSTSNTTQHPDLRRSSGVDNVNSSSINSSAVAVALRADVYIQDIFDDSKAFDAFIKSIHTSAQTSSETNNSHSNNNTNNHSHNFT